MIRIVVFAWCSEVWTQRGAAADVGSTLEKADALSSNSEMR